MWESIDYNYLNNYNLKQLGLLRLDSDNNIPFINEYIPAYEDYLDLADYIDEDHPNKIIITILSSIPLPHIFYLDGFYLEMFNLLFGVSLLTILFFLYKKNKETNLENFDNILFFSNKSTQTNAIDFNEVLSNTKKCFEYCEFFFFDFFIF